MRLKPKCLLGIQTFDQNSVTLECHKWKTQVQQELVLRPLAHTNILAHILTCTSTTSTHAKLFLNTNFHVYVLLAIMVVCMYVHTLSVQRSLIAGCWL